MRTFKELFLTEATYNKGDVFEFVFAAVCVARFSDRNTDGSERTITPRSVRTIMTAYFNDKKHWSVESADGATDYIEFKTASINDGAMNRIANRDYRNSSEVTHMIERAIDAVENRRHNISKLATEIITNGISDDVVINPVGTSDQSGTKSDVDIEWDGHPKIRISLKFDSGQFGQFASSNMLSAMTDAWDSLGMPLSGANKTRIRRMLPKLYGSTKTYFDRGKPDGKDLQVGRDKEIVFDTIKQVFRNIARVYGKSWLTKEDNIDTIVKGFKKSLQGTEKELIAVLSVGSKTQVLDKRSIKKMKENLMMHSEKGTLRWELLEENTNPTLALKGGRKTFFQVRLRWGLDPKASGGYKLRNRTIIQITREFFDFVEL